MVDIHSDFYFFSFFKDGLNIERKRSILFYSVHFFLSCLNLAFSYLFPYGNFLYIKFSFHTFTKETTNFQNIFFSFISYNGRDLNGINNSYFLTQLCTILQKRNFG